MAKANVKKAAKEDMKLFLDAMEISRLHQMADAAEQMDKQDIDGAMVKEDENGK